MMTCLDKVGRTIDPGDYVVYGHALGRCAGLRIGKVLKITQSPRPSWKTYGPEIEWKITVRGVDDDCTRFDPPCLCKTNGTLQYPNRLIRLELTQVPLAYQELLDPLEELG